MNVTEAIATRKSVRAYLDKQVLAEDLARIVEAGQWPPNAGAFQISVIRNADLRSKIDALTHEAMLNSDREFLQKRASLPGYRPLYGAPVLLLLSGPADGPYSAVNAALAAENMILAATGLGLGSCFIVTPTLVLNRPENDALAREAGIPEGYAAQCAVIVGYAAAEDPYTLAERAKKGVVSYID